MFLFEYVVGLMLGILNISRYSDSRVMDLRRHARFDFFTAKRQPLNCLKVHAWHQSQNPSLVFEWWWTTSGLSTKSNWSGSPLYSISISRQQSWRHAAIQLVQCCIYQGSIPSMSSLQCGNSFSSWSSGEMASRQADWEGFALAPSCFLETPVSHVGLNGSSSP